MDNKTFIARLARQSDSDASDVSVMLSAFINVLRERAADLDSVAIPGFGNFVAMKRQERIVFDAASGKRNLTPPKISMEFIAGSMLKKNVSHE